MYYLYIISVALSHVIEIIYLFIVCTFCWLYLAYNFISVIYSMFLIAGCDSVFLQ